MSETATTRDRARAQPRRRKACATCALSPPDSFLDGRLRRRARAARGRRLLEDAQFTRTDGPVMVGADIEQARGVTMQSSSWTVSARKPG